MAELTLFRLRATYETLLAQEAELEARSAQLRAQAAACVRTSRAKAAALLRRRHMVDEAHARRLGITNNTLQVITTLESTMADATALRTMRDANATMKWVIESSGMTVEVMTLVCGCCVPIRC